MMKTAREKISIALLIILSPIVVWSFLTLKTHSLYHPESTSYADPWTGIPNIALKKKIQNIYFTTVDKVRINGWYVPPQPGKPSIVFAHGNGGNQGDRFDVLQAFVEQGYGFFSFDYRGYGKSRGTPSEAGLYHDLEAASLYLQQHGIPIKNQIAMGESLGSGVVVDVAARTPYRAVVLYSALSSAPAVAAHLRDQNGLGWLGFLPLSAIMQQHFDSLSKINHIQSPLLIMHGDKDDMMPLTMPRMLLAKSTVRYKKLLIIPGAGHNSIFQIGRTTLLNELNTLLNETKN